MSTAQSALVVVPAKRRPDHVRRAGVGAAHEVALDLEGRGRISVAEPCGDDGNGLAGVHGHERAKTLWMSPAGLPRLRLRRPERGSRAGASHANWLTHYLALHRCRTLMASSSQREQTGGERQSRRSVRRCGWVGQSARWSRNASSSAATRSLSRTPSRWPTRSTATDRTCSAWAFESWSRPVMAASSST